MADCNELGDRLARLALSLAEEPRFDTLDKVAAEVQKLVGAPPELTIDGLVALSREKRRKATEATKARAERLRRVMNEANASHKAKEALVRLTNMLQAGERLEAPVKVARTISESLRILKAEEARLSKMVGINADIQDLVAGKPLPKRESKAERDPEVLALRKKRKELKDAERKLKQESETLADLNRQLETGDFAKPVPRQAKEKTALGKEIEAKRKLIRARKAAETRAAKYREQIAGFKEELATDTFKEAAKREPKAPESELEAERNAVRQERNEAKRFKTKMEKLYIDIANFNRMLNTGDLQPPTPRVTKIDERLEDLVLERAVLRAEVNDRIRDMKPATALDYLWEVFALPRELLASGELSGVARNAAPIAYSRPSLALKGVASGIQAVSKRNAIEQEAALRAHPYYLPFKQAKLDLTVGSRREEGFGSKLADKVPVLGRYTGASERTYSATLNTMRFGAAVAMAENLAIDGKPTREEFAAIAKVVNILTGRAALEGKWDQAMPMLSTVFFAPRYAISRFQMAVGIGYWGAPKRVKKLIRKEYARFAAGWATAVSLLALAAMAYNDDDTPVLEFDPRSSDFLKIRFGNTRVDTGGGLLQPIVLAARTATGETKSVISGKIRKYRGESFGRSPLGTFFRGKLAPAPGLYFSWDAGSNLIGEPINFTTAEGLANVAKSTAIPLAWQELYETMQEHGPAGAAAAPLLFVGIGASTYQDRGPMTDVDPGKEATQYLEAWNKSAPEEQQYSIGGPGTRLKDPTTGKTRKLTDEEREQLTIRTGEILRMYMDSRKKMLRGKPSARGAQRIKDLYRRAATKAQRELKAQWAKAARRP